MKRAPARLIHRMTSAVSSQMLLQLSQNHGNSGASNAQLVANMKRNGLIDNDSVCRVLFSVDRADYVPESCLHPYKDAPVPTGRDSVLTSPHTHAHTLNALWSYLNTRKEQKPFRAADLGCGVGMSTLLMYKLACIHPSVGAQPLQVTGYDVDDALVATALRNTRRSLGEGIPNGLQFKQGRGLPREEGLDFVNFGFAVKSVPTALSNVLVEGGAALVPIGEEGLEQAWTLCTKRDGQLSKEVLSQVIFSQEIGNNTSVAARPSSLQTRISEIEARIREIKDEKKGVSTRQLLAQEPEFKELLQEYRQLQQENARLKR